MSVNISMTAQGAQPTPPATLRSNFVSTVSAARPGYTASLPGSLIEDISSTSIAGLSLMDQGMVDLINSMTPQTMNAYLLGLLGAMKGITPGALTNASAYVTFAGFAGTVIPQGFLVSDGLNQYATQSPAVLGNAVQAQFTASISGNTLNVSAVAAGQLMIGDPVTGTGVAANTIITGVGTGNGGIGTYTLNNAQTVSSEAMVGATHGTAIVYVVATQFWQNAIPVNSITTIITPKPSGYPLFVTNPNTGVPAQSVESVALYRARTMDAERAPSTGQIEYLKSLLRAIPGVQYRLVSVSQAGKILVGGGDPYAIAAAIYRGLFDLGDLAGSLATSHTWSGTATISGNQITLSAVTGTVQTNDIVQGIGILNPTIITGQVSGTPGGNGVYSINSAQSIPAPTAVTGAGSVRNQIVSIISYPDTYLIVFVVPISQSVEVDITWSTTASNFTASVAVGTIVGQAISDYVNSIPVGVALNINRLNQIFLESVSSLVDPSLISALTFTVKINGVITAPTVGTSLVPGDSEGYFVTLPANVILTRV